MGAKIGLKILIVVLVFLLLESLGYSKVKMLENPTCTKMYETKLPLTEQEIKDLLANIDISCIQQGGYIEVRGKKEYIAYSQEYSPEEEYPAFRLLWANGKPSKKYIKEELEKGDNKDFKHVLFRYLDLAIDENVLTEEILVKQYGIKYKEPTPQNQPAALVESDVIWFLAFAGILSFSTFIAVIVIIRRQRGREAEANK